MLFRSAALLLVVGVVRWARGYVADLADRLDVLEARVSDVERWDADVARAGLVDALERSTPTERRATEPPTETMAVCCDFDSDAR